MYREYDTIDYNRKQNNALGGFVHDWRFALPYDHFRRVYGH